MSSTRAPARRLRWSALPGLLEKAPPRVLVLVGILVVALGGLIVVRPLASLVLLGIYIGLSAIVAGVVELISRHGTPGWWTRLFGIAWILGGIAVLIWFGRNVELLPIALAILLVIGGLATLGDAMAPRPVSIRVLTATWGIAQIGFGLLSRTWPDVTLLLVAVVFGVRSAVFGVSLIVRGVRTARAARKGGTAPRAEERSRRRRAWAAAGRYAVSVLLVALVAGSWSLNEWLSGGAPVVDAFYSPPDAVPDGHGRLIRAGDYPGRAPANGEVTRILYTTEDAKGRAAVASAMVISPTDAGDGPHPVIVWEHGTTGVARGCAPSLADGTATKWAIPALEQALAAGWVVVATDYSGQGAPGVFPYLIGEGEARSSLDAVLAAGEIDTDLVLSPKTVVWGHSQGGHAALWTTQVAPEYTPGLDIRGTAAIAPAADPAALAEVLAAGAGDNALLTIMVSWVLVPYSETYGDIDLDQYVTAAAEPIIREMTQRCLSEPGVVVSALTALGLSEDQPVDTGDLTSGAMGRRLAENTAKGPWGTPILVAWGAQDEVLPPSTQEALVERLCAAGERVRWQVLAGNHHQDILQPPSQLLPMLMRWTTTLMNDDPSPLQQAYPLDDCTR
jgi:uncharacterized membrane protein HdeD (DUF308 family)/pimeloyl-ACP methyl ester carboxylesterase